MQAPPGQILPLRDIKLPAEPGFWPLAPGWWVLVVLIVLITAWVAVKWYKHNQKKRRWLQIDQQLSNLEFDFRQSKDKQQLLADVSMFLRRFVKFHLQQGTASTLAGGDWLAHLNQRNPGHFDEFEQALIQGVFEPQCDYNPQALIKATRQFIQQHVMRPVKAKTEDLQNV